ncbi:branched-chain amino acid ABC transporter permease [Maritimibacter alkaliphilus]|jgi:branched-chain amino acid transport system permease protein|uniref:branched-chain amino acid ABC transporter permease n=1 Tax=Maritimibacter alkaliphilus TaxID=404236 RepID=UPI001C950CB8|nr:branched-chain amino acid ABC transporter permease [Maritimibacter alkaliphilus]MBY6092566.1 branched-chain amino acid ABC transporter permease [Maritimibacter alkaliphilus]
MSDLFRDLFPLVWSGMITGCLYALGALGLVMIFKSSRVVNFSHGNVAGFAAFLIYGFSSGMLMELSWGAAVLLAVIAVIAIAFMTYALISPLVFESDLTATIATLGIGLIAQGATLLIFGADIVSLDLPIPRFGMSVLGLFVTGYDLTVLAVAIVTIAALFFVIDHTKLGVAFRAISENPFAAEVCGLNLRSVHLFSWMVAAVLGVVGALLIVPTTFLSVTTVAAFMLQAFAAAVIGGFASLPGALLGGILIGVLMNLFTFYVSPEFSSTFLLGVILLALNIFPNGILERVGGTRV